MICEACRDRRHGGCRGGTWCDCQHHLAENATTSAEPAEPDQTGGDEGSEPGVNWLRQG